MDYIVLYNNKKIISAFIDLKDAKAEEEKATIKLDYSNDKIAIEIQQKLRIIKSINKSTIYLRSSDIELKDRKNNVNDLYQKVDLAYSAAKRLDDELNDINKYHITALPLDLIEDVKNAHISATKISNALNTAKVILDYVTKNNKDIFENYNNLIISLQSQEKIIDSLLTQNILLEQTKYMASILVKEKYTTLKEAQKEQM